MPLRCNTCEDVSVRDALQGRGHLDQFLVIVVFVEEILSPQQFRQFQLVHHFALLPWDALAHTSRLLHFHSLWREYCFAAWPFGGLETLEVSQLRVVVLVDHVALDDHPLLIQQILSVESIDTKVAIVNRRIQVLHGRISHLQQRLTRECDRWL